MIKKYLMKLFHINLLLSIIILLNGCIRDDTDSCPAVQNDNLILEFYYTDNKGTDIFSEKIHKVDIFIFDNNKRLVLKNSVGLISLSDFKGIRINLPPGVYHIISWANADTKTIFAGLDTGGLFNNAFLGPVLDKEGTTDSLDPLYYAQAHGKDSFTESFCISVPEHGIVKAISSFKRAHIKINLFIKGLEDKSPEGGFLAPLVEIAHTPSFYNFEMQTFGNPITYRKHSSLQTVEGQQIAESSFCTPVFSTETPMEVNIRKQSDGSTVATVSLKEFIIENNIKLDNNAETVISILVEFKGTSIGITVPGWAQSPIDPELDQH